MEMQCINDNQENSRNPISFVEQMVTTDNEVNSDFTKKYCAGTQRLYLRNQLWAACAISMGSLNSGFATGFMSSGFLGIKRSLNLSFDQIVWVANIIFLAAVTGSLAAAAFVEYCGRRRTIIGATVPFFIGWIFIACASNLYMIIAGRIFIGISTGIISSASPIYLCESVQPELRGALGILPSLFRNGGILLATVVGIYYDWYKLAFFGAGLSVVCLLPVIRIAESPRWYMVKGRSQDSRNALKWLRGNNTNIETELQDITRFHAEVFKRKGNVCVRLFKIEYMSIVLICLGLFLFQLMSGINFVMFTLTTYVRRVADRSDEIYSSFAVLALNMIVNVITIVLIDRIGRKMLLYISSVFMIISLVMLGLYTYIEESYVDNTAYYWIPLLCIAIFVLGYAIGFGSIPFLMLGEILPMNIRGTATGLAVGLHWALRFYKVQTVINVISTFGRSGTYWFYAVLCSIGLLFVKFFMPETRGRSLEEIEKELTGEPLDYEEC